MHPIVLQKDRETGPLDLAKLIPSLEHFFHPSWPIFFADFTLSVMIGNTLLILASGMENGSWLQILFLVVSACALFRASAFIHELFHSGKKVKGFMMYYNVLHGFLHKAPAYVYNSHKYHHSPRTYGTLEDPEYDNLGERSTFYILVFSPFLLMLASPVFLMLRWGIVPIFLPFIGEKLREAIYVNASTLVLNLRYKRPLPTQAEKREWYLQDAGCLVYSAGIIGLLSSGVLPWNIVVLWCVVVYLVGIMNYLRVLLNHRYLTGFNPTSHKQQVIDSVTFPLTLWNAPLYPVGLGYHALHHMFPQIPYHNMGKAHEWLIKTLPENHPYHLTVIQSYRMGVRQLLARSF